MSEDIRQAEWSDLAVLLSIERDNMRGTIDQLNADPWSDATCLTHLKQVLGNGWLWVYDAGEGAVGHYAASPMEKPGHISLDSLQVEENEQRKGIGSQLLEHFLGRALEQGYTRAVLNVHIGNPSQLLYERAGLAETHRTARHVRMEKELQ